MRPHKSHALLPERNPFASSMGMPYLDAVLFQDVHCLHVEASPFDLDLSLPKHFAGFHSRHR